VADASEPATAQRRHLGGDEFLLAPAQAGTAGAVDALVETDPRFEQRRAEAENPDDGRQLVAAPLPPTGSNGRGCARIPLLARRSLPIRE